MRKKIMIVFGTRPEAIKLCPLVLEFKKHEKIFNTFICVTAQHREMLDQVLNLFKVTPDIDLNIMKSNQTLVDTTILALEKLYGVIQKTKPDLIIVQGDTTTTFVASLAAYYNKIPVGHVEAGLRTGNKYSPYPEEINRRLTSSIVEIHFAPTEASRQNLLHEGFSGDQIFVTGNTVIDALCWAREKIQESPQNYPELEQIDFTKRIILMTGHRRENFGPSFIEVCKAVKEVATQNDDVELVYPVHLNPNVKKTVTTHLSGINNIKLLDPLDYAPFVFLMDKCFFIISDSGGIQEEAPSLGKPVLVTRDTTERPEALEAGAVLLVGTDRKKIINESHKLLTDIRYYNSIAQVKNPYGDGHASQYIVDEVKKFLRA